MLIQVCQSRPVTSDTTNPLGAMVSNAHTDGYISGMSEFLRWNITGERDKYFFREEFDEDEGEE